MQKVERNMVGPIGDVQLLGTKQDFAKVYKNLQQKLYHFFITKGYLLLVIGFLFGRALILSQYAPFILPFFAVVFLVRKDRAPLALVGLISGAATLSFIDAAYAFGVVACFLILFRLGKKWVENEMKALPYFVFIALLMSSLGKTVILTKGIETYDWMMGGVISSLGFILTYIFLQGISLIFTKTRHMLKTEEMICLIILLASVLTGTIGWSIYGYSIDHIMARYLVILFSFVAGATVGSTVGVVTGLIFSLANVASFEQMSLLAFAGLLGGLLKEGKRVAVSTGLIIATLLMGMYGEGNGNLSAMLIESGAAAFLLFFTPNFFTSKMAKMIPGTAEFSQEQQSYIRKVRDLTAQKVERFSSVFQALSNSFSSYDEYMKENERSEDIDLFLSQITEKTCNLCFRKKTCWAQNFNTTYESMQSIMTHLEENNGEISNDLARVWGGYCAKSNKVLREFQQQFYFYQANQKLKRQIQESRKLVADQLLGVSVVMDNFAKEIKKERENHFKQEESILETLKDFGLEVEHIDIYSLEKGNVDIDMTIPYCKGHGASEKIIAPMLSDILGETIVVSSEECGKYPGSFCQVTFRSSKKYVIDHGAAYAAKGGGFISGDSYATLELNNGKYAVAISDGMGNGERAHIESKETLKLLKKILQSGIEEKVAIKSINSILSLRTTDEIFSTLDLAMIDLQSAEIKFLKIGSSPSFIKRGDKVIKVQANNLPIGILQDVEVDIVKNQLKAGDILIMMSDGVFEGPKSVENFDLWMKRKIKEIKTNDPQEIADLILEEVIRSQGGHIEDDMTVVVSKIEHNTPKWATIPVHQYRKRA